MMVKSKIGSWNSLVTKTALWFTVVLVIALALLGFFINREASKVIYGYSQGQMEQATQLARESFYALLDEVTNDIGILSRSPTLEEFINLGSSENYERLKRTFKTILEEKPNYFQVRLLDATEEGRELLKFEKVGGLVRQVPEGSLQSKGGRDYFQEAIALDSDFYYSEINLNEEFGAVSDPPTPTLRALGKVYDQQDRLKAIIVINVDLGQFFGELDQIGQHGIQQLVVDSGGTYVYSPNPKKRFGKQLDTGQGLQEDFGLTVATLWDNPDASGELLSASGERFMYHMEPLTYSNGLHHLLLLSTANRQELLAKMTHMDRATMLALVVVCLLLLVLVYAYAKHFSKRVSRITHAIVAYGSGAEDPLLGEVMARNDETGVLAQSFGKMRREIDARVAQLQQALEREQKAVREKNEFLQNMGHELRTPLHSILGLTEILEKNEAADRNKALVKALYNSARNLKGLMHDILDQQKLLEGKIVLLPVPTNIGVRIREICSNYTFEAARKGLDLRVEIADLLTQNLYQIDPLRFDQMVTNLLVNALKYTNEGYVLIQAILEDNGKKLRVVVEDTGRGIAQDDLEKIHKRFVRGDAHQYGEEGFGLGLSIVKQLVELFGGVLEVDSTIGKGSTFEFQIPLVLAEEKAQQQLGPSQQYPVLGPAFLVLHIEDDVPSRMLLQVALEPIGLSLEQCGDWNSAQEILEKSHVDLLITDLIFEGKRLDNQILNSWEGAVTTILVTSALDPIEAKVGSLHYRQKPLEMGQLLDFVVMQLGKTKFGAPQFRTIYESYDNNKAKIAGYFDLLDREFVAYHKRFEACLSHDDEIEWEALRHKIITHINAMEMEKVRDILDLQLGQVSEDSRTFLLHALLYLCCCIREERRTIPED